MVQKILESLQSDDLPCEPVFVERLVRGGTQCRSARAVESKPVANVVTKYEMQTLA